jgi:hypothetical protein
VWSRKEEGRAGQGPGPFRRAVTGRPRVCRAPAGGPNARPRVAHRPHAYQ